MYVTSHDLLLAIENFKRLLVAVPTFSYCVLAWILCTLHFVVRHGMQRQVLVVREGVVSTGSGRCMWMGS